MRLSDAFLHGDRVIARATGLDRVSRGVPGWMMCFCALMAFGLYSLAHCAWYVLR